MSAFHTHMVTIHNTDLFKELKDGAKLQQLSDRIPSELAEKVVPVMEVNPKLLRRANLIKGDLRTSTGAITLTMPTNKDNFINSIYLGIIKDVTCDMASGVMSITGTQDGATIILAAIPILTLTAQSIAYSISFPNPIKLDRGTNITTTNSFTAGNVVRSLGITGYSVDNVTA